MKVLHLIPSLGSGGAERQLSLLAPALHQFGTRCTVAYVQSGPNLKRLQEHKVPLHALPIRANHDPRTIMDLTVLVRQHRPHLIQTWLLQMDVFGGLVAHMTRTPWILSERSTAEFYVNNWKTRLRAKLGQGARAIVANSEGGLNYWRQQHPKGSLHWVPNCVSPEPLGMAPTSAHFDQKMVMFAGRFSPEKNVQTLIEAFIELALERTDLSVRLFGDGPLREQLEQTVARAGLSGRIQFMGYSDWLADWMRRAAVCVSVSHFEGHPNVVLEAASLGCPLVLSDIPAHRSALGHDAALFVSATSASAIVRGISQVLDDEPSARVRAQIATNAVQSLSVHNVAAQYQKIYEQALT
jgi:glycosyltransferase involved in cell wall biosynthesis